MGKKKPFLIILIIVLIILGIMIYTGWYKHAFDLVEGELDKIKYRGAAEQFRKNSQLLSSKLKGLKKIDRIQCPVYYINLDRSPERKEHIEAEFSRYDIKDYQRIPAVDGKKLTSLERGETNGFNYVNKIASRLTPSELGCTLSHLIALITAYKNNLDRVLIVEDDVAFALMPFWSHSLPDISSQAPADWEILHLFQFMKTYNAAHPFLEYANSYGALSYLANRKGMEKIISKCLDIPSNTIIIDPLTDGVSDVYIYDMAKTYSYTVPLFYAENSSDAMVSTIHPKHALAHIARMNEITGYYLEPAIYITKIGGEYFRNFLSTLFPYMKETKETKEVTDNPKCVIAFGTAGNDLKQKDLDKYSRQFKIVLDGEPHDLSALRGIDLLFTTKTQESLLPKDAPRVYLPFWLSALAEGNVSITDLLLSNFRSKRLKNKQRKFCAFMYSNCDEGYEGVAFRKKLLDKLQQRSGSKVEVIGRCYNPNYSENGSHTDAKNIYNDYKFVIAVENSFIPGYITEKLTNPLLSVNSEASSAIPIYMGAPDVSSYFNPNRMVHVRDFPSLDACLDRIMQLHGSEEEYQKVIDEPIFPDNEIPEQFTWTALLEKIKPYLPSFLGEEFNRNITGLDTP